MVSWDLNKKNRGLVAARPLLMISLENLATKMGFNLQTHGDTNIWQMIIDDYFTGYATIDISGSNIAHELRIHELRIPINQPEYIQEWQDVEHRWNGYFPNGVGVSAEHFG